MTRPSFVYSAEIQLSSVFIGGTENVCFRAQTLHALLKAVLKPDMCRYPVAQTGQHAFQFLS